MDNLSLVVPLLLAIMAMHTLPTEGAASDDLQNMISAKLGVGSDVAKTNMSAADALRAMIDEKMGATAIQKGLAKARQLSQTKPIGGDAKTIGGRRGPRKLSSIFQQVNGGHMGIHQFDAGRESLSSLQARLIGGSRFQGRYQASATPRSYGRYQTPHSYPGTLGSLYGTSLYGSSGLGGISSSYQSSRARQNSRQLPYNSLDIEGADLHDPYTGSAIYGRSRARGRYGTRAQLSRGRSRSRSRSRHISPKEEYDSVDEYEDGLAVLSGGSEESSEDYLGLGDDENEEDYDSYGEDSYGEDSDGVARSSGRTGQGRQGRSGYGHQHHGHHSHSHTTHYEPVVIHKHKKKEHKIISVHKGSYIEGGVKVHGKFKKLYDCQKACGIVPLCYAGDYDPWQKACYLHSSDTACDTKGTHHAIVHFKKVPCDVDGITARNLIGLGVANGGALEQKHVTSLKSCLKKCTSAGGGIASTPDNAATENQICYGIDFDFGAKRCYLHVDSSLCGIATITAPTNQFTRRGNVSILLCPTGTD